jgi:transcriptional regulator with XRE-family HTH domain
MAIGDKILTLRKERGWSQQKLAQKVGTSGPIIGRYERGEMVPSVEVAKKLADTFGITLDYLVDDTGGVTEIKDKVMLKRLMELEALDTEDQKTIVHVLDSLLRDAKAKKAYAPQ